MDGLPHPSLEAAAVDEAELVGLAAAAYRNIAPVRSVAACMLSDSNHTTKHMRHVATRLLYLQEHPLCGLSIVLCLLKSVHHLV